MPKRWNRNRISRNSDDLPRNAMSDVDGVRVRSTKTPQEVSDQLARIRALGREALSDGRKVRGNLTRNMYEDIMNSSMMRNAWKDEQRDIVTESVNGKLYDKRRVGDYYEPFNVESKAGTNG